MSIQPFEAERAIQQYQSQCDEASQWIEIQRKQAERMVQDIHSAEDGPELQNVLIEKLGEYSSLRQAYLISERYLSYGKKLDDKMKLVKEEFRRCFHSPVLRDEKGTKGALFQPLEYSLHQLSRKIRDATYSLFRESRQFYDALEKYHDTMDKTLQTVLPKDAHRYAGKSAPNVFSVYRDNRRGLPQRREYRSSDYPHLQLTLGCLAPLDLPQIPPFVDCASDLHLSLIKRINQCWFEQVQRNAK